jgi:PIN domain nuclease of toxin-antitoxin system
VKLILDTHAALWWLAGDDQFGSAAAEHLEDETNQVLLSAAVVLEVAIKRAQGKLEVPDGFADTLLGAGVQPLPITLAHTAAVEHLPWHHRDPFDRLLVAQAGIERAAVVTRDDALAAYDVTLIW